MRIFGTSFIQWTMLISAIIEPAIAQSTLNLSRDLVSLGIASQNMVPNQSAVDAGPLLTQGMEYAKRSQIARVIADPGAYYFLSVVSNTHVALSQINNMTLDFQGADLIFTHPLFYGIIVYTSTNAVLQNFTADYQPLPFTQVRVVAVDVTNAQIQYSVEPGWQDPSSFNSLQGPPGASPPRLFVQIFRNGRPAFGTRQMLTQLPLTGNSFPLVRFTAEATPAAIRPGDIAVLALRAQGNGVSTNHCTGCTLRNITVFSGSGGAAAVSAIPTQSTLLERVYAIPKPGTDRLVSTYSAVAVGFSGPNNQVRLSRGIRTMDDTFWFFGRIAGTVQNQISSRSLAVDGSSGWTAVSFGDSVPNGSPVTFQRPSDGVILGSAVIVSQNISTPSQPSLVTFNFDRDLPGNIVGAVMYSTDPNQNGANSLIERSTAQNQANSGRGIYLAGLANSSARGNYIRHSAWAGIMALQGMTPGDPPTPPLVNLSIANNVIDSNNTNSDWWWFEFGAIQTVTLTSAYDLMNTSPLSNITVTNNFVANPGRSAVWIGNTAGGNVSGNYFLNPNDRPDLPNADPPRSAGALIPLVVDSTSSGITTSNNTVDKTSGYLFVTDAQYRELAAYAPGSTIRLNSYNLGELPSPSIVLTDADGKTAPVTLQSSSTHALDVQIPSAAGLGGAFLTLTSGGTKYFGTLFLDSQDNIPAVNGCTWEISPSTTSLSGAAASLSLLVITQAGCSYQATSADSFVTVGGSATGTGVLSLSLAANTGGTRTATVEISGQPITLTQGGTPGVVGLNPPVSSSTNQNYAFPFSDSGGYQSLAVVNILINNYLDGRHACYLAYSVPDNALYIVPDSGDSTQITGKVMDGTGTVSNGQCSVNLAASSVSGNGSTLTLNLAMSFSASFSGAKVIYMAARNAAGGNSGWQTMGVHGAPPLAPGAPNPVGMSPASGNSANVTLTLTYQDAASATSLQTVWALINTAIDGRNACYVAYYQPGNTIYLYPDNGDGTQAASTILTGSNSLSNSQCRVSAQGSSVTKNGNQLVVTLNIGFKPGFAGPKAVWLAAQTLGGAQTSPWQALGACVVGASTLADSTADFSTTTQGANNWYYGFFPNGDPNQFTQFPSYNTQRLAWFQSPCCPPWTWVGPNLMNPVAGNGTVQSAVREWVSPFAGQVTVSVRLYKQVTSPDSVAVYGQAFQNHQQVYSQLIAATDSTGVTYSFTLNLKVGDVLDFAAAANGNGVNNTTYFSATISTSFDASPAPSAHNGAPGAHSLRPASTRERIDRAPPQPATNRGRLW